MSLSNYARRDGHLSQKLARELSQYLRLHPPVTVCEVRAYVLRMYGQVFSRSGMSKLLGRLGFVYKKPKHLPLKADVQAQADFIQSYKARLSKFDATGAGRSNEEIETAIRQTIDQALVSEKVIDIFDAAGIKKPNISILDEDFLLEVKNMKHKNVALELLKRLLAGEIKARTKTNLVQSKSLMEMLQNSIQRYHNKIITAAEFMDELINHAKTVTEMDKEPEELGLTPLEYGFYTAVADNGSAIELMGKEKLRELAVILFEKVKENASIDWTIKESVRAKLKVIIKRTLRKYGYPPDMQLLATETVLEQAKLIADELTRGE